MMAAAAQDGSAKKDLGSQSGWPAIRALRVSATLELTQEIKKKQYHAESRFRGKKRIHTKIIGSQIFFELGDSIFNISSTVVVTP